VPLAKAGSPRGVIRNPTHPSERNLLKPLGMLVLALHFGTSMAFAQVDPGPSWFALLGEAGAGLDKSEMSFLVGGIFERGVSQRHRVTLSVGVGSSGFVCDDFAPSTCEELSGWLVTGGWGFALLDTADRLVPFAGGEVGLFRSTEAEGRVAAVLGVTAGMDLGLVGPLNARVALRARRVQPSHASEWLAFAGLVVGFGFRIPPVQS
jgi:hypothetical protein